VCVCVLWALGDIGLSEYVLQRATTEAKVDAKRIVKVGVLVGRDGGGELQSRRRGCLR
jgi:hypothetical protein